MRIIKDRPPMWERIDAQFQVAGKPILFAWGDCIYNPEGVKIPRELLDHEDIHGVRQMQYLDKLGTDIQADTGDAIAAWWTDYLESPEFRLQEEIPAHRAEYLSFCKRHGAHHVRNKYLQAVAVRLASPLYGSLLTPAAARDAILTCH